MVRVDPVASGKGGLARALNYITNHGHTRAVDQGGRLITGAQTVRDLTDEWATANDLFAGKKSRIDAQAVPIILSMPAGTDRGKVEDAAIAWARKALVGHDWIGVPHRDTDNPHVHFLVRSVGEDGRRFRAGPAQIREWRRDFAEELRARGIEATATARDFLSRNERDFKELTR
jgi:type IV secretory pathway VirD2 relaxase